MDIIRFAISRPVTVTVGVIMVLLFGLLGFQSIPIQLTPAVNRPVITVTTMWPGRSPEEIIDEITKEQEERLKNISNLKSMRSVSREGQCEITLEMIISADIARALQEVGDALRQVPSYPEEVDEPTVKAAEGAAENAIAWMIIDVDPAAVSKHPDFDISTLFDALDREVKPFLERTEGVAEINVFGGREREVQVLVDAGALAQRSLRHQDVVAALRGENRNVSAGSISEGKRDYRVRLVGKYASTNEILETLIAFRDGKPVHVKDVATVKVDHQKRRGFVRSFGATSVAINCIRQTDANVVEVMTLLRDRIEIVRDEILPVLHPTVGRDLRLRQVYDETVYIDSAVELVTSNLWIGGAIAAVVLLLFLRSFVSTGVIALAIPISVIGTFLALLALGRSLNVISMAGLAFAVGMVVDNAIVVLENIYRRLQEGESPREAAYAGAKEVWGAILASTLTTVAVFVPVLTIQEEAGQLFRDISLAIVASVSLSLVISITVIPAACSRWLRPWKSESRGKIAGAWQSLFGLVTIGGLLSRGLGAATVWLSSGWRGWTLRPAIIVALTLMSISLSLRWMPPLDYLPAGNRNLVFGFLLIPPGYSIEQKEGIAERIETLILPFADADINVPEEVAALPPIRSYFRPDLVFDPVPVENFFLVAMNSGMFVGATSQDPQVVSPIGELLTGAMNIIPDAFGGARQSSIFGRGVGGGNRIDLEVSGPQLGRVTDAANFMLRIAAGKYGYGSVRPDPSNFNLTQPELRLRLNRRGRELGLSTGDLALAVRGFFDGAFAGDFVLQGDTVDLLVLPAQGRLGYKEQLGSIPIVTPGGEVVPFDAIVDIVPGRAPQEVQRIEELPSVTIQVSPPPGAAIEAIMQVLRDEVIEPARQAGMIDATMRVRLEGTAAKLDEVKHALFGDPDSIKVSAGQQKAARVGAWAFLGLGGVLALIALFKTARQKRPVLLYGACGGILLGVLLASAWAAGVGMPYLGKARFVWALIVTYLLLCSLFESFIYPFVIMFSVPLAVVGGFAGLSIVHEQSLADPTIASQQLDVLTMLGFVILIGVVVNNAILIVHQALNFMQGEDGLDAIQAVGRSVQSRVRPIFMSTLTSVGGMLPLVLMPGAGSEMYRGLGSVVIGGLLVSSLFTLLLVPLLFTLILQMSEGLQDALRRSA